MLGRIGRFLYRHLIDDPRDYDRRDSGDPVLQTPRQEAAALRQRVQQLEEMVLAQQALYLQQVLVGPQRVGAGTGAHSVLQVPPPVPPSHPSGPQNANNDVASQRLPLVETSSLASAQAHPAPGVIPPSQNSATLASSATSMSTGTVSRQLKESQVPSTSSPSASRATGTKDGVAGTSANGASNGPPSLSPGEYYPQGNIRLECPADSPDADSLGENSYVWRNYSGRMYDGEYTVFKACRGVLVCSDCHRPGRTPTQLPTGKKKSKTTVQLNPCRRCSGDMEHISCRVQTRQFTTLVAGKETKVWIHEGTHEHPQPPPGGRLNAMQQAQVDEQVAKNPTATPHQLRNGTLNSVPLHEIAEKLARPRSAAYQVKKSQQRQGVATPSTLKGGFAALSGLLDIKDKDGTPFLVESSLDKNCQYLMFQTEFQRKALETMIQEWEEEDPKADTRHGMITDGNHSFFKEGVLMETSVFLTSTGTFVPVLYTWIKGEDTAHHYPHFSRLNKSIVARMIITGRLNKKDFMQVMDYSAAQRKAFAEAYADAIILFMGEQFTSLPKEGQDGTREGFVKEAEKATVGCTVHFLASARRLRDTSSLVPPSTSNRFMEHAYTLINADTTNVQFESAVAAIQSDFPMARGWLKWWMQPWVPSTTNAVEHQHSLLNHACGTGHDLIAGVKALLRHIQELAAQVRVAENGGWDPPGPREPPQKKKMKKTYPRNDGRPPDTVQLLESDGHLVPAKLSHVGYEWKAPNSCFVDASAEMWFRNFFGWDPKEQEILRSMIPKKAFLLFLVDHYLTRNRLQLMGGDGERSDAVVLDELVAELKRGQEEILRYVHDVWKLVPRGTFHCAATWLALAVRDSNTPMEVQAHFGIRYIPLRHCANGHITIDKDSPLPVVVTPIQPNITSFLRDLYRSQPILTPEHYFRHYIPKDKADNYLHKEAKSIPCSSEGCPHHANITSVQVSWPKVLNCSILGVSDTLAPTQLLQWPTSFNVIDPHDGKAVQYSMTGRVLYGSKHYTSEVNIGGKEFAYDSIVPAANRGKGYAPLTPISGAWTGGKKPQFLTYMRTSHKSITQRLWSDIMSDGEKLDCVVEEGRDVQLAFESDEEMQAAILDSIEMEKARVGDARSNPVRKKSTGNSSKPKVKATAGAANRARRGRGSTAYTGQARGGRGGRGRGAGESQHRSRGHGLGGRGRGYGRANAKTARKLASESEEEGWSPESEESDGAGAYAAPKGPENDVEGGSEDGSMVFLAFDEGDIPTPSQPNNTPAVPECGDLCDPADEDEVIRCIHCFRDWHLSCLKGGAQDDSTHEDKVDLDEDSWFCPTCFGLSSQLPLDAEIVGRLVLIDVSQYVPSPPSKPLLYPARVRRRVGSQAQLVWYSGNMYPNAKQRPTSPHFMLDANECLRQLRNPPSEAYDPDSMGTIGIPPPLHPASFEEWLFRDSAFIPVIHESMGSILDVLQGHQYHPIIPLLRRAFRRGPAKGSPTQRQLEAILNFEALFDFPIFPGHDSMLQPFLRYFQEVARGTPRISNVHINMVHALGSILLRTVATRVHLGMQPQHDTLVFLLAYSGPVTVRLNASFTNEERDALNGELMRTLTAPEEVYAASKGRLNRSIQPDLRPEIDYGTSAIHALLVTGQPYPFPEAPANRAPLQSQESLPPLPPELREVLPQTPRPEGWQRPKPRPVGTSPPKSAPKATFLYISSPIFDILAPLEEKPRLVDSDGTPTAVTTHLPPAVERRKRKHQPQANEVANSNPEGRGEQKAEYKGTEGSTAMTRTLRTRGPAGTVVPRQSVDSSRENPPAKRRKVSERYVRMLEDSEGNLHRPPGDPDSA